MNSFWDAPIEARPLPCTEKVVLIPSDEEFVDVFEYSHGTILVKMEYVKAGIPAAIKTAYLRRGVADRLLQAKRLLPEGYTFEILDAFRPFDVQEGIFNSYAAMVRSTASSDTPEEEIIKKTCEFVSYPDKSIPLSYVHSSGGAVDITIIDEKGERLDMGSAFDEFSERSYTAYYERGEGEEIRKNRRLLYGVLTKCGFTNYPSEWWHYDYGDAFWAYYKGENAIYPSKFEEKDVKNNDSTAGR